MRLTAEQKQANVIARRVAKKQAKIQAAIESERNQRPIEEITISIEWKKSRMWGNNPFCDASVKFKDGQPPYGGQYEDSPTYTCSGCGYDKESTVVADVFNDYLKYKLWGKTIEQCKRADYDWKEKGGAPYGINAGTYKDSEADTDVEYRHFDGGIGINCYYAISEFLGGKFEKIASGKTYDVYKYTEL